MSDDRKFTAAEISQWRAVGLPKFICNLLAQGMGATEATEIYLARQRLEKA